jgi:hypothetical protein
MPRTASKGGAGAPRRNPAVNQPAAPQDADDTVLDALNADRAAPDPSGRQDRQRQDAREAAGIEEGSLPEEPARSRPTH